MHSDDEPEIKPDSEIASYTLGATRKFVMKVKDSFNRPAVLTEPLGNKPCSTVTV